jgi:hypothetical protein
MGLGDASEGCGSFALLVVGGSPAKCCGLEDGAALYYVVPLGGKEWEIFRGLRKKF